MDRSGDSTIQATGFMGAVELNNSRSQSVRTKQVPGSSASNCIYLIQAIGLIYSVFQTSCHPCPQKRTLSPQTQLQTPPNASLYTTTLFNCAACLGSMNNASASVSTSGFPPSFGNVSKRPLTHAFLPSTLVVSATNTTI
jgi:hypothetical protein